MPISPGAAWQRRRTRYLRNLLTKAAPGRPAGTGPQPERLAPPRAPAVPLEAAAPLPTAAPSTSVEIRPVADAGVRAFERVAVERYPFRDVAAGTLFDQRGRRAAPGGRLPRRGRRRPWLRSMFAVTTVRSRPS